RSGFERHGVHDQTDLLQLVAKNDRGALTIWTTLLGNQSEMRRLVLLVLEHAVVVAIGQPNRGEQLLRPLGVVRGLRSVPVPLLVGGRLWTVDRHAGAEKHGVGEELAIDRHRDGASKLVALQP